MTFKLECYNDIKMANKRQGKIKTFSHRNNSPSKQFPFHGNSQEPNRECNLLKEGNTPREKT